MSVNPAPYINPTSMLLRSPSNQWVEDRKTYLGATDIAAIMGLHPYKTSLGVYQDKKGLSPELEMNLPMVVGINLEERVAKMYSQATGRRIRKSLTYRDKEYLFLACNPDYIVLHDSRLLECKTSGYWGGQIFGEQADSIPDQYLVQCMWQLAITGRQVCDLAVMIDNQDYRIYTIERDEYLIAELRKKAIEWWNTYILADCPPPLSGDKPDVQWVKDQYPSSVESVIHAPPIIDDYAIQLSEIKEAYNALGSEKSRLENEIKNYMKEAAVLETTIGQITWKSSKSGSRTFCTKFKEAPICQAKVA